MRPLQHGIVKLKAAERASTLVLSSFRYKARAATFRKSRVGRNPKEVTRLKRRSERAWPISVSVSVIDSATSSGRGDIAITRDGEAQSVMMRRDQSHPSTLSVASHKPRHAEGGLSSAPVHRT